MPFPSLLTNVVLILFLACSLAWGRPPVKSKKGSVAVAPYAEQANDETLSGFLPSASGMEANLASTLCSGLWTHSTYKSCFLPTPTPQYKCQYCARACKSRGGLTKHENKCKIKPQITPQNQPPPTLSVSPYSPDCPDLVEEHLPDEELPLTLAECSRLVSAYIEHPEWQDFLDSGRHATTRTTAVKTGWEGLKLDTVSPAGKETPFPALAPEALERLMQLSPTISRLHQQLQTGKDPLANRDDLKAFINNASQNELFAGGNHSLVIKWRQGPGYVFKIARSERDQIRLNREKNLYLWLRAPDKVLLNLTTTPMRAAFSVSGKPVLALRQVDGTARDRLRLMREHSLNERLDFAVSVLQHFCQMYSRFLEKDVLLTDRHDDNIGFNEIPLQERGIKSVGLDDAIIQVPVMLDLDPYWFGDQEATMAQLHLPTWVPVMTGLFEEVFTPVSSNSQISESRVKVIDQIRKLASPAFSSSSAPPETEEGDIESALQSCINHWFQEINPENPELQAEARSHIEQLLIRLNQWDSTPRTVAEWNKRLKENIGEVLQWLNSWKNETGFSLLKDFTDEGIIRVPGLQGSTTTPDQEIFTLLSMINGKLGCPKCSRTFNSNTEFTRHWQLHKRGTLQHCEVCNGDFYAITEHARIHTGEKPYKCRHCGKVFSRSGTLHVHLRTHSGDKPYRCEHCSKCFAHPNTLKIHLRIHSGDLPYRCLLCGKGFSVNSYLKKHLLTHSSDKPCQCDHCGKCFVYQSTLKCHLRTHSGDKPYQCRHCGKCFAYKNVLKSHLLTHTGAKPYQCEHCGKCFSQACNLKSHLRIHSGDKPYKCQLCGKCFSDSGNLKRHLRTHSGDKPHTCEHCGKSYSQAATLIHHLRTHSGDKPYRCEHCGMCFSQSNSLHRHLRTHSSDQP